MTTRRAVLAGLLLAPAVKTTAQDQGARVLHVGFLSIASPSELQARIDGLRQGLRDFGWIDGQNLQFQMRWAAGDRRRLDELAADLGRQKLDLIIAHGTVATQSARAAAPALPIVCAACGDLVAAGLVASLAHPGGTVTGMTIIAPEISGKRVELLRALLPTLTQLAVLWNPSNPVAAPELRETEVAARQLAMRMLPVEAKDQTALESAIAAASRGGAEALLVLSDAMFAGRLSRVAELARAVRLPSIAWTGEFADAGGLLSYGPNPVDTFRRAGYYADRIAKGAKPGELAVEQPTRFEFVVNQRTARSLALTLPAALLLRADRVIE